MNLRSIVCLITAILLTAAVSTTFAATESTATSTATIKTLRLRGDLDEARKLAKQQLDRSQASLSEQIALQIELARILDRIGLHQNKRPVAAALQHIETAALLSVDAGPESRAAVELALADYHYRAEMQGRAFPTAETHARRAIKMFQSTRDGHGEADAVHRLGLIEMQRSNLATARRLFDRSKELDVAAGERVFFTGEYERHVGFVLYMSDDVAASVPYFERSLIARRKAGAIDASLFAAISLAAVLVELERRDDARPLLMQAMELARQINSPVGQARTEIALGRLYAANGEIEAARHAFETTIGIAESVHLDATVRQARAALDALGLK